MKQYFSFNPDFHDFWPIYKAIINYYPIGITYSEHPLYNNYEGQKKLNALIADNIHNQIHFKERLVSFTDKLRHQFGLEVKGTTYGQQPAFSFEVILEKTESPGYTIIKKLCVSISLLGEFYTIFGVDQSDMIEAQEPYPHHYPAINVITVSPYGEYEQLFLDLKRAILELFPNYKLVPLTIATMYFKGLYDKFNHSDECMIYHALFDRTLDHDYSFQMRGDMSYGYDEWIVEGFNPQNVRSIAVMLTPPPPPFMDNSRG